MTVGSSKSDSIAGFGNICRAASGTLVVRLDPLLISGWQGSRSETGGFLFELPKASRRSPNNFGGNVGTVMQADDIQLLSLR